MITKIRDFFWPVLERPTTCEVMESRRSESDDINSIQNTGWAAASKLALEEARLLASEEDERRKTAESKASNLLVVTAALIPLLTYLETAILDSKLANVPTWVTLPLLAIAVAYLGNAGWWAFKTVDVGAYHRVYPLDLVKIWREGKPIQKKLIIETFIAIRRNQETVNWKVSASKMTHAFLLRAVMAFSLLLMVRISFGLWGILK